MPAIDGSKRWIFLGPFSFQPSELGKLLTVFVLSKYLADQKDNIRDIRVLVTSFTISIVPALLVFRQPDLGTALIYLAVVLPMLYWAGVRPLYLFLSISPLVSVIAAFNLTVFYIWMVVFAIILFLGQPEILTGTINFIVNISFGMLAPYVWNSVLYPHQRLRVLTLLDPMRDPQGAGYQVLQSMTAIGSGGFWGKGLGNGTQTHLRFLPVRDTDFIISVIGEEMGLFAIMIILIAISVMLYWLIGYARKVQNRFSSLVLIGFTVILFSHIIVNMGMTVGYFPVTGLPAPFLSYGGSFLLTCTLIIALANNIINNEV
jgi:rod shape determining protein RodA